MHTSTISQATSMPMPALPQITLLGTISLALRWLITVATVACLAWSAQHTLGALNSSTDGDDSSLTVHSFDQGGRDAGGGRPQVWLDSLIVDGQLLRWESLRQMNGWEAITQRGSGLPPSLLYKDSEGPALVHFQGSRWLATIRANQWAGTVRVEQQGTRERVVEVQALQGPERQMIIESPEVPSSSLLFMAGIAGFSGLAWWCGPIRRGRSMVPWLILFLSVFHLLFWVSQCVGTNNDSPGYLDAIREVFVHGEPSYFPPGYPALLGIGESLSGEHLGRWITLVQHGMAVLGGLWIYLLLLRIVPGEVALFAGILAGALTPTLTVAQAVMSETPTFFAMAGALYFTVRSAETGHWRFAVLAGVLTGWAGTLRVVPLAALLPSICLIYGCGNLRGRYRQMGVTLITAAFIVLLPISWCWYKSGRPQLTYSQGFHLFNRVVTEQRQLDAEAPATSTLLTLLDGMDPRGVAWWDVRDHGRVRDLSDEEAELLFRRVSMEGIRKDPWAYFSYTPLLAWRMLFAPADWIPAWGDTIAFHHSLESPPPLGVTGASLAWREAMERAHRVAWPILCWAALGGLLCGILLPGRALALALAWVPAGYLLSSAGVEYFSPRYNAAVAPFVAALAVIPLPTLCGLFGRTARSEREVEE